MASTTIARSGQESTTEATGVPCFRHEGEECPRCDGSGTRPLKRCAGCGEPEGSIGEGTGRPLVGIPNDPRGWDGPMYHVGCNPDDPFLDAHHSCLERMVG